MSTKAYAQIKRLKARPQPIQRSDEWFLARKTKITASEAAACIPRTPETCHSYLNAFKLDFKDLKKKDTMDDYTSYTEFIKKKIESKPFSNKFTMWGQKYEPIAQKLYTFLTGKDVEEFGLLPHARYKWLGASPDGICPDGTMLEIKCPFTRVPSHLIPIGYWVQTQIQMEVCNLDTCDFLQCMFNEMSYEEYTEMIMESECVRQKVYLLKDHETTVPFYFNVLVNKGEEQYEYPELNTFNNFELQTEFLNKFQQYEPIYYSIIWTLTTIKRDKEWFKLVKPFLLKAHKDIETARNNHVQPVHVDYHIPECEFTHDDGDEGG